MLSASLNTTFPFLQVLIYSCKTAVNAYFQITANDANFNFKNVILLSFKYQMSCKYEVMSI